MAWLKEKVRFCCSESIGASQRSRLPSQLVTGQRQSSRRPPDRSEDTSISWMPLLYP